MKTLDQYSFKNKRALIRVDFNVPLDAQFNIKDDSRIKAAIPTIQKILNDGGSAILMSHLGRPKEGYALKYSLSHLVDYLKKNLTPHTFFAKDCIGEEALQLSGKLKAGEVLLLENLRFYKQEEKGDKEFSSKLAQLGDVYVNDAFGTAHRAHASTTIVADFFPQDKVCGYLMLSELENANKAINSTVKPFTAIMGGAKISDKILVIENLLNKVDNLIIGGAMSYTFIKAMGGSVGNSLVENDKMDLALQLMEKAKQKGVQFILPVDSVVSVSIDGENTAEVSSSRNIADGLMGLDIGTEAIKAYKKIISESKTILWNGPMGVFEKPAFSKGTFEIATAVADVTQKGAFSLIGGGDSASAINNLGFASKVSYVSTGGGALLEYFEGKVLPGVKALE